MSFKKNLIDLNAPSCIVDWAGDRTLKQIWNECQRGDWMLWLLQNIRKDNGVLKLNSILHTCRLLKESLHLIPSKDRSLQALLAIESFCDGKMTGEEYLTIYDRATFLEFKLAETNNLVGWFFARTISEFMILLDTKRCSMCIASALANESVSKFLKEKDQQMFKNGTINENDQLKFKILIDQEFIRESKKQCEYLRKEIKCLDSIVQSLNLDESK